MLEPIEKKHVTRPLSTLDAGESGPASPSLGRSPAWRFLLGHRSLLLDTGLSRNLGPAAGPRATNAARTTCRHQTVRTDGMHQWRVYKEVPDRSLSFAFYLFRPLALASRWSAAIARGTNTLPFRNGLPFSSTSYTEKVLTQKEKGRRKMFFVFRSENCTPNRRSRARGDDTTRVLLPRLGRRDGSSEARRDSSVRLNRDGHSVRTQPRAATLNVRSCTGHTV